MTKYVYASSDASSDVENCMGVEKCVAAVAAVEGGGAVGVGEELLIFLGICVHLTLQ